VAYPVVLDDLNDCLQLVPTLFTASPDHFLRSLEFCSRKFFCVAKANALGSVCSAHLPFTSKRTKLEIAALKALKNRCDHNHWYSTIFLKFTIPTVKRTIESQKPILGKTALPIVSADNDDAPCRSRLCSGLAGEEVVPGNSFARDGRQPRGRWG
jgi:hypothetical protein